MRVADLMRTEVESVRTDDTVMEAVTIMADARISGLPVLDGAGKLTGVVTSTDILQAEAEVEGAEARQRLFADTTVGDLMTMRPHVLAPDDDVRAAAQTMMYAEVRRLFVVERDKLVGVLSQTDIARAVATGRL